MVEDRSVTTSEAEDAAPWQRHNRTRQGHPGLTTEYAADRLTRGG
jgi:hypothetical protein